MIELCISCGWWVVPEYTHTLKDGRVVHCTINNIHAAAEWCLDLTDPFTRIGSYYPKNKRLFMTSEPDTYTGYNINSLRECYSHIWTHQERLLNALPDMTTLFTYTVPWVHWDPKPPKFGIGAVFSPKNNPRFSGYAIRKKIIDSEGQIKIDGMIYSNKGSWKGNTFKYPLETKERAFDWMFHLAIENCQEKNYFTEKIIDCFLCRCVPVYYGDPNIGRTFNTDGIIRLNTDNPIDQINALTPEDYTCKRDAIEDNYQRAVRFRDKFGNVLEEIVHDR